MASIAMRLLMKERFKLGPAVIGKTPNDKVLQSGVKLF